MQWHELSVILSTAWRSFGSSSKSLNSKLPSWSNEHNSCRKCQWRHSIICRYNFRIKKGVLKAYKTCLMLPIVFQKTFHFSHCSNLNFLFLVWTLLIDLNSEWSDNKLRNKMHFTVIYQMIALSPKTTHSSEEAIYLQEAYMRSCAL